MQTSKQLLLKHETSEENWLITFDKARKEQANDSTSHVSQWASQPDLFLSHSRLF